jgi:hypothetical protein
MLLAATEEEGEESDNIVWFGVLRFKKRKKLIWYVDLCLCVCMWSFRFKFTWPKKITLYYIDKNIYNY